MNIQAIIRSLKSTGSSTAAQLRECRRGLRDLIGASLGEAEVQEIRQAGGIEAILAIMVDGETNIDVVTYALVLPAHTPPRPSQ